MPGRTEGDPMESMVKPIIDGTVSVFTVVYKYAPQVKRIVLTSSALAMFDPFDSSSVDSVYNDESWSPITVEQAKKRTSRCLLL
jgi:NADPH-dependent methylglyoxal reductase